jgi:(p)ppGpp synthase/HD superfamily hydrolase
MSFVKTVKAKSRIRLSLKKENKELHRERWKEILLKYFEKFWLKLDKDLTILKNIDWKNLSMDERLALLEQIWNFSLPPASVIRRLLKTSDFVSIKQNSIEKPEKKPIRKKLSEELSSWEKKLVIWWERWLNYRLCYCLRRKLPSDIVAHINNKWIITIHRRNCKVLNDVNKDRLLPAYIDWEQDEFLIMSLKIIVKTRIWVLKDITDTIFSMWIEVDSLHSKRIWNFQTEIVLDLKIWDYDYLIIDRFIDRVKLNLKSSFISSEVLGTKKM